MNSTEPCIYFHYLVDPFYFPHRKLTKDFILSILQRRFKKIRAVNYIFCSDEYLLLLNQTHLKHDYYTDVITFELSEKKEPLLADVYISVQRARENARLFKVTLQSELLRLLIHGALHLCGLKDKNKGDRDKMKIQENFYLNKYFVSRETNV